MFSFHLISTFNCLNISLVLLVTAFIKRQLSMDSSALLYQRTPFTEILPVVCLFSSLASYILEHRNFYILFFLIASFSTGLWKTRIISWMHLFTRHPTAKRGRLFRGATLNDTSLPKFQPSLSLLLQH